MTKFAANPEFDIQFLDATAEFADAEVRRHDLQRRDWSYHDLLTRDYIAERSGLPSLEASPEVKAIFLGNLAVEHGHAEYDRITAERFEVNPAFRAWKNIWIAEEQQHGAAMLEWAKISGLFETKSADATDIDMQDVHAVISGFLRNGLTLSFDDTAHGLAYPALQEPATKVTHREVKDRLPEDEKVGRRLMSKIIADEERHERFYANMVAHALHSGDVAIASHQMRGVARAVQGFSMPGIEADIPMGGDITRAYAATGAFTVAKVVEEVLLPAIEGDGTHGWQIASVESLDDSARGAQESLIKFSEDIREALNKGDRRTLLVLGKAKKHLLTDA